MLEHKKLQSLEDFFKPSTARKEQGVYFYRMNGYNEEIRAWILKYYEVARTSGVVIEGKIPNPDEKNLAYYGEIMGMDFSLDIQFVQRALGKWMPRMKPPQRQQIAGAIVKQLTELRAEGKTENMLKNAYIKFMCWLYYRFEQIAGRLGEEQIPKILYEGSIGSYELMLISILSNAGCDVVLLQYGGDAAYRKLDPDSKLSDDYAVPGLQAFPKDFSLKGLRQELAEQKNRQRLYGKLPEVQPCTNAWMKGDGLADVLEPVANRGQDNRFFYNCFYSIQGVEDKLTYQNELYDFYLKLKNANRKVLVLEGSIELPTQAEIQSIRRGQYQNMEQMIQGLVSNLQYPANPILLQLMRYAFIDMMFEEGKRLGGNVNKLVSKAVYLLCWIKRYLGKLFSNWKMPEISCLIVFWGGQGEHEQLLIRYFARLPVDVVVLNPDLNQTCGLEDPKLYELRREESLSLRVFPKEEGGLHIGTAAYHAEQDLNTMLYGESGLYRNQQYSQSISVTLHTMYEEIQILWDQELKYRPNFQVADQTVRVPVIFAKVSGVKDGDTGNYWSGIKALLTEDTIKITEFPYVDTSAPNPVKPYATEFFKHGKLQKEKIKKHAAYQYGYLREEVQNQILDKLQMLIEQKIIRGTFQNGTEYTIVSIILNMNKTILRMIQKFDLTKKNPKVVCIHTGESTMPLEDAILMAFLNLVGFDIVFFVPTGYRSIEGFYQKEIMEEHQIGEYQYDLQIPDFAGISLKNIRHKWREKFFKRGT